MVGTGTYAANNRANIATRMTSAEISAAYDLASEWLERHRNK